MWNDEIVDQVRAVRLAHAAAHGHDLKRIFLDLKRQEAESDRKVVTLTPDESSGAETSAQRKHPDEAA